MATKNLVLSMIQTGDKSKSAMYKAFDNANTLVAEKKGVKPENKKKKK